MIGNSFTVKSELTVDYKTKLFKILSRSLIVESPMCTLVIVWITLDQVVCRPFFGIVACVRPLKVTTMLKRELDFSELLAILPIRV